MEAICYYICHGSTIVVPMLLELMFGGCCCLL